MFVSILVSQMWINYSELPNILYFFIHRNTLNSNHGLLCHQYRQLFHRWIAAQITQPVSGVSIERLPELQSAWNQFYSEINFLVERFRDSQKDYLSFVFTAWMQSYFQRCYCLKTQEVQNHQMSFLWNWM